jgi:hypothetical protein
MTAPKPTITWMKTSAGWDIEMTMETARWIAVQVPQDLRQEMSSKRLPAHDGGVLVASVSRKLCAALLSHAQVKHEGETPVLAEESRERIETLTANTTPADDIQRTLDVDEALGNPRRVEGDSESTFLVTEYHPLGKDMTLASELFYSGLVFMANQAVFHHHGYALGVEKDHHGTITHLTLHKTDDPEGIWFDEESVRRGRAKLLEGGLLYGPKTHHKRPEVPKED